MTTSQKAPLHALTRGLKVIERVSESSNPLRFSDLREVLPGVGDSTLARLLSGLVAEGYLARAGVEGYAAGPRFEAWREKLIAKGPAFELLVKQVVADLVSATDESAGVCVLSGERLVMQASHTVPGAVSIIAEGETLYFEPDHSGSLTVLSRLKAKERNQLIGGSYSRIVDRKAYSAAIEDARWIDGVCMDHSNVRPGICRIAKSFKREDMIGSVFYCLTLPRAESDLPLFAETLDKAVARLEA